MERGFARPREGTGIFSCMQRAANLWDVVMASSSDRFKRGEDKFVEQESSVTGY